MDNPDGVQWPARYAPGSAPVHVRNALVMQADAGAVWAWLIRARLWPTWYPNAANVEFLQGAPPDLATVTRFRWRTFGVTLESTVREFVERERIAWDARGTGVDAYHAWVIRRTTAGCHVLTEETQHGWLARVGSIVTPQRMHKYHQLWLERLRDNAARGFPPAA
jgi:hypothetical protein